MKIKDKHTQLALALLLRILLTSTTDAVVAPGQYSSYQPQSYYSQSLSNYGNENQNYFDNPGEQNPTEGYSNEPYQQRQEFAPTSYDSGGGAFDNGDQEPSYQGSYQSQASFQAYLAGKFLPSRHEQDSVTRQGDDGGRTSLVSFDNIDLNKSETTNHQPMEDVLYPPLNSEMHEQHQHHQYAPRQQDLQPADYMTANNYIPSRVNYLQSMPYLYGERTKDNAVRLPTPSRTTQMSLHHPMNAKPYIEHENQLQHQQDQQQIPRTRQHYPQSPPHYDSQFTNNSDRLSTSSPSRTYYVADSDLSDSSSKTYPADAQSSTLLHSHLVQLPVVSSPTVEVPVHPAPPSFAIPSEPIPISKHVEITKHVPVPIYRQIHVPVHKPVRIEIPRPVISTVPRPYPFQIPTITKTVAVPMVKEVKIPIEKLMPYPVEHRVPYVVEKRVPFQIEKQIAAPIYYPFPVKVPMVRTILHKKKAHLPSLHYHPRIHM